MKMGTKTFYRLGWTTRIMPGRTKTKALDSDKCLAERGARAAYHKGLSPYLLQSGSYAHRESARSLVQVKPGYGDFAPSETFLDLSQWEACKDSIPKSCCGATRYTGRDLETPRRLHLPRPGRSRGGRPP